MEYLRLQLSTQSLVARVIEQRAESRVTEQRALSLKKYPIHQLVKVPDPNEESLSDKNELQSLEPKSWHHI